MILNVVDSTGGISATPSFRVFDSTGKLKGMGTPVGSVAWGSITGTITAQTDLISYLSGNYVPLTRNITINGVTQDLSADRTWTISAGTGTVTSVGLTMPSAFLVSGSPVTSSGTLGVTATGTSLQYIDGTGALQTLPTGLPPTGTAGGDLNGTYPNPTVDGIHGIDMQSGTPTSGDTWVYGGSPAKWQHQMLHASQVDNDSAVTGTHVSDALDHLNTTKVETTRTISTTSPLSGGGDLSANRTLSISQATGSTSGYLSSTDWTTFNGKESALTFNSPLSRSTNTISIPAATSSVNGYLTSTDWSTFNNKAGLASPAFTGDPTAPTPSYGDNDTSIATTAFVQAALNTPSLTRVNSNLTAAVNSTSLTTLYSFYIPANTVAAGDMIYVVGRARKSPIAANGNCSMRIYVNTSATAGGSIVGVLTTGVANNVFMQMRREISITNTTNSSIVFINTTSAGSDDTATNGASNVLVIDWTVDQYIILGITPASSADTWYGAGFRAEIKKYNP